VTGTATARHWDDVYRRNDPDRVSWFEAAASVSMEMIAAAGPVRSVVDVGGGASVLVEDLLAAGVADVTVLDISAEALRLAQLRLGSRLGARAEAVRWVRQDVRSWSPPRRFDLWHDRAVFHFLTDGADRDEYRSTLHRALAPGGWAVIGTFAEDGPSHCSGLPVTRYGPGALAAEFPDLSVVKARRAEHVTPAGVVQPFTWLLLSAGDEYVCG
jgi:SAM-dependent methyltransferase